MELDYQKFIPSPEDNGSTIFFIEILEANPNDKNEWIKVDEIHERPNAVSGGPEHPIVYRQDDEYFTSHAYNAILSNWSGKEIQIHLTSTCKNERRAQHLGRWLGARLVGSTFDFKLGE